MKKHPYLYFTILVLVATPFVLRYLWNSKEPYQLNVLVIDKTVLEPNRQEHTPLFWILENEKFVKKGNLPYDKNSDYYGFFPDGKGNFTVKDFANYSDSALSVLANKYDMAYYTDLYGVYTGEWYELYPNEERHNPKMSSLEPSDLIYGGMSMAEVRLLKKMKEQGKLIITEFNVIGTPTPTSVAREFEKEFKMSWQGWVGRYYSSLDTNENKELPIWLKKNYTKQNGGKWPFKEPGIIFVRTDEKIVILEKKTHLNLDVPLIETNPKFRDRYDLPKNMKFHYWFDIISASDSLDVLATYKIDVNAEGQKILEKNFIPTHFPAAVKTKNRNFDFYYFAGDFSDIDISMYNTKFAGVASFNQSVVRIEGEGRSAFFWRFYRPLVGSILDEYNAKIAAKKN
ncbi:hypothetical protein [Acetobacteroides hydrogenigenes]|uniref:Uncharacterized protein n=1 Tax=Acetobacteroides hydrogenigenes TaxID=979970 RepID=A0A4R2E4P9_9BACT|nr:hypothetical protein [Acetobacteroides hydrogenigenes]TCN62711.1 hypothetical protein CLV25_11837 [Acetobacteroides hydrogenigenes]